MTQPIETLKIWPEFFHAYLEGRKPFEIRQQDRPFEVGYLFRFKEWDPEAQAFTGRVSGLRRITYLTDFGIKPGFVAFAHEAAAGEEVPRG